MTNTGMQVAGLEFKALATAVRPIAKHWLARAWTWNVSGMIYTHRVHHNVLCFVSEDFSDCWVQPKVHLSAHALETMHLALKHAPSPLPLSWAVFFFGLGNWAALGLFWCELLQTKAGSLLIEFSHTALSTGLSIWVELVGDSKGQWEELRLWILALLFSSEMAIGDLLNLFWALRDWLRRWHDLALSLFWEMTVE